MVIIILLQYGKFIGVEMAGIFQGRAAVPGAAGLRYISHPFLFGERKGPG
jgi:hypothetical protein